MDGGIEYFGASNKAEQGFGAYSSGNFPVVVIYSLTGMAVVGAGGFFYWSNKRANRPSESVQTGIHPKYLRTIATSEASGGYHTNRGEGELVGSADYESHKSVYDSENRPSLSGNTTDAERNSDSSTKSRGTMPKGWKPEN